ncbi:alpha/beta hydrolase [Nocardioides sp.]|uniref:alpha/beta hydrolase n=1 Tax=Nocardioides sp. TaxID=35761 RepID=UPI002B27A7FA|nr:alpha/beta hydrolase [Nocardioides sp.]
MSKKTTWVVSVIAIIALGVGGGATAALVLTDDGGSSAAPTPTPSPSPETGAPASPAPTSDADPVNVPEGLERFYEQVPAWTACGSNECATLTVPVDYAEPDGATIDLNLERTVATDQAERVGSLVVNPGGPGAPGTSLVEDPTFAFGAPLLARMDIVAFDPRGTGESAPIDCVDDADLDDYLASDPSPDDAGEIEEFADTQAEFFAGCVESTDDLIGHVSTVEAARDMDVLRGALREDQLDYLGFSYGTTLGGVYAELFAENVGRFVLDGATDPTLDFRENSLSQARGFQTALDAYVEDCVAGADCFLGDSLQEGLDTISELLEEIEADPLPTADDRDLQIGNAFYGIVTPLYSRDNWPFLDQALQEALSGQGDTLLLLADFYSSRNAAGGFDDNSLEAFLAINCLDDPTSIDPAEVPAEFDVFDEASPTFGRVFAWGLAGCRGVQVEAAEPTPTITGEGAAPIVVLGTTRDPATPYEEAVALAEQLESGVLVTRDGDGHTAYNKDNACIDAAVEDYLLEGAVPEDGLTC